MHEMERSSVRRGRFVGRVQAMQDVGEDAHGDRRRHLLAGRARLREEAAERLAVHVLHDQEKLAPLGDDVEHGRYIGVEDARCEARFVDEHRRELGVSYELRVQAFDRDDAPEASVPDDPPEVHGGHSAGGDHVMDFVEARRVDRRAGRASHHSKE